MQGLNERVLPLATAITRDATSLGAIVTTASCGTTLVDCGSKLAPGSIELGLLLARVCLADLAEVQLFSAPADLPAEQVVSVATSQPLQACMFSQYAGWKIASDNYFAMGSGPMRAKYASEAIFREHEYRDTSSSAVGVLEGKLPSSELCLKIASDCAVEPHLLTLLAARTASLAGTLQVVARSVETALHKMHALGFDLSTVRSGSGTAPLVPIAADDLGAIGWTNDAVLYGGDVTLHIDADDAYLASMVDQIPSCSSKDFGTPFREVFERYEYDFYKIDPLLFSPAKVTLVSTRSHQPHSSGQVRGDILSRALEASSKSSK